MKDAQLSTWTLTNWETGSGSSAAPRRHVDRAPAGTKRLGRWHAGPDGWASRFGGPAVDLDLRARHQVAPPLMELQTLLCRTKGYRQSKTKTAPTGSLRSRAMPTVQSKARRKCAEQNEFDVSLSTSRCLFVQGTSTKCKVSRRFSKLMCPCPQDRDIDRVSPLFPSV